MNVELLRKIQAHILEEPMRVYMGDWGTKEPGVFGMDTPPCGTVACISGWAAVLSGRPSRMMYGEEFLELDRNQENLLFYTKYWPTKFRSGIRSCHKQTAAYAKVVSERIDHFIATGGAE